MDQLLGSTLLFTLQYPILSATSSIVLRNEYSYSATSICTHESGTGLYLQRDRIEDFALYIRACLQYLGTQCTVQYRTYSVARGWCRDHSMMRDRRAVLGDTLSSTCVFHASSKAWYRGSAERRWLARAYRAAVFMKTERRQPNSSHKGRFQKRQARRIQYVLYIYSSGWRGEAKRVGNE